MTKSPMPRVRRKPPRKSAPTSSRRGKSTKLRSGRTKGQPQRRLTNRSETHQAANTSLLSVGWLCRHKNAVWVEPEPEAPPQFVKDGSADAIETGAAVRGEVRKPSTKVRVSEVTVLEDLGSADDDKTQLRMAEANLPLPKLFPETVTAQTGDFGDVDVENSDGDRRDLRDRMHVTIDGEHARDFDDAVSAVQEKDGYRVWISIADVASYVKPRSAIDKEARLRGTSVYLPTQVFPMLPEKLSNDLCSLLPGEPRFTVTCEMHVGADGERSDIHIYPSLIHSAARLTYTQVQHFIDRNENIPKKVRPIIQSAIAASRLLRNRRFGRGSLDLEIPEAEVIFNKSGKLENVLGHIQMAAHQVIEDLMVAANESVAEYLLDRHLAGVYRVHPPPPEDKWTRLRTWAKQYDLSLSNKSPKKGLGLAPFLKKVKRKHQAEAGQMMVLRSLSRAYYSAECEGHFGLASDAYAHFTSPIRRYPDLLVHRALWNHWNGKSRLRGLDRLADGSSEAERRAMHAERDIIQLAACLVAKKRIGEEMQAMIVGIHAAGLFVRPEDLYADGLVPITELSRRDGEYFEVCENSQTIVGRNSRSSYGLGDALKVKMVAVNVGMRRINFELASLEPPTRARNTPKEFRETKKSKGKAPRKLARRKSNNKRK